MKEKFIDTVKMYISEMLSDMQLSKLQDVLDACLDNLSLSSLDAEKDKLKDNNIVLMQKFISSKRIEGCSDKTIEYYMNTLNMLLDDIVKSVEEISTDDIRGYLANYQEQREISKVTLDNIRRIFSSFFTWLEDEDYILKSPVRRIHRVKEDKIIKSTLSDEEIELMRDNCYISRDLAIIDLLNSTGMRVGELIRLNVLDIDFENRECIVLGKGSKERIVYFDAKAKVHLQEYISQRTDANPALFVSLRKPNNRLGDGGVQLILRKLGDKLSIKKVHPHKFRRTMATSAIDKGMPIEQLQNLLGHEKIDTTMHYVIVNKNNVKISHRKYIG